MSVAAISHEQTLSILTGPRELPADITNRVESMLATGEPIVDIGRFSEFIAGLMVEVPADPVSAIHANYKSMLTLASCSIEMAWQQAATYAYRVSGDCSSIINRCATLTTAYSPRT